MISAPTTALSRLHCAHCGAGLPKGSPFKGSWRRSRLRGETCNTARQTLWPHLSVTPSACHLPLKGEALARAPFLPRSSGGMRSSRPAAYVHLRTKNRPAAGFWPRGGCFIDGAENQRLSFAALYLLMASVSFGTTALTSPTMPRSAVSKMGASALLLMAMM